MAQSPASMFDMNTIEGAYLSPVVQEVRSYLARVVGEIVTAYTVDGIHMDYIRYPGRTFDFSERARNRFISMNGIDPVKLYTEADKVDPTLALTEKWADFRAEQVDEEVRLIANRIALSGKKIALSAAVKPHTGDAYYEFGQNWPRWLREDLVDFVAPMSYYPETGTVEQVLKESLKGVDKNRVIGGIGVYKLTPARMLEQVALMERLGLGGYCFFSYTSFKESPELAKALESIRRKP